MDRPEPWDPRVVRRRFTRGRRQPRGVVWFGVRSFWGHLRHFIASAIATEDVDSRDWMSADDPAALVARIAAVLRAPARGDTLAASLGRDVWVDYVADTGDDVSVSRAVAALIFAEYALPDPARPDATLHAPRGDILLFGGDTAYPVATADEIEHRVIVPYNQVLAERADGVSRVLLGIPGNHDWYDGLDGFGRMFRRHIGQGTDPRRTGPKKTMLTRATAFAREFLVGGRIVKPRTLDLLGYTAVQSASYFALPVAPALGLLAVDRQLKDIDSRQQHYFLSWLNANVAAAPWIALPDPVCAFGEPSPTGPGMIDALGLNLDARPHFVVSGDIHHYRREEQGPTLHVTSGGGGAFLHPAPIARGRMRPAVVEFPGPRQSRALLWSIPFKVMFGRSGILPHLALLLLFLPTLGIGMRMYERTGVLVTAPVAVTVLTTVLLALIGGIRHGRIPVLVLAFLAAATIATVPLAVSAALTVALQAIGWAMAPWGVAVLGLSVAVLAGTFVFGAYLAALTAFGLENQQAFTALDHPGYKEFVRLRVHADGSAIDGWCIGLVDPLGKDARPVLVDRFTWRAR